MAIQAWIMVREFYNHMTMQNRVTMTLRLPISRWTTVLQWPSTWTSSMYYR
uniref:Uncharacterized protein n=1 Tax=Hyaloperonospora arabidopsidis (strain Emoy2) TaxID=559515 RepID=M4BZQ9_HYAAE